MSLQNVKQITITCSDGESLAASVYQPTSTVKGAVMMAPATGIKRLFYASFANYLANNDYGVITFDNRGIGGSSTGPIAQNAASLQCWGEKDMPAVLECLQQIFPQTKYHLMGHSAGGQLIGLMHNAMDISSMFNFACSSGQLTNMKLAYLVQAHFFMNFFIPLSNAMFGHTKSQWLGMGEPLPKSVAKQWQQWCNGQGYVKTAFGKTVHQHCYNELTLPSLWVNAVDDDIANNANVADMMSVFPKLNGQTLTLTPSEHGLSEIGHMKFFSSKSQALWPLALDWLDKH
ncbi:alpha/beta fold hydrolase [Shewanella polaris]|uniref:Alpha/beta fold hydrolase n=1 Tax=Shewanella polaris TaxID=2588449 RepID=A0A4Y5YKA8_9GAMM|nr:alpha/beta fold hydrolase [Shewanella polaris]QDE32976.1 alpha/beta fold hydrolase [Shewanella polaris]